MRSDLSGEKLKRGGSEEETLVARLASSAILVAPGALSWCVVFLFQLTISLSVCLFSLSVSLLALSFFSPSLSVSVPVTCFGLSVLLFLSSLSLC